MSLSFYRQGFITKNVKGNMSLLYRIILDIKGGVL